MSTSSNYLDEANGLVSRLTEIDRFIAEKAYIYRGIP